MKKWFILFLVFLAGCVQIQTQTDANEYDHVEDIFIKAIETKDASICDQAGEFSNRCYNHIARLLKNPDLCKVLPDFEPGESACGAAPIDYRPKYCGVYEYGDYDEDFGKCIADASGYNIEKCKQIIDKEQSESCLVHIFENKANLTNSSICSLLKEEENKEDCKIKIIENLCTANTFLCSVQSCLDLNFSLFSTNDECKQIVSENQCEANLNSCSFEICNQVNFSSLSEEEKCKHMLIFTKCVNNVQFCDPLLCENITYTYDFEKDDCKQHQIENICDDNISACNANLCTDSKFYEENAKEICDLEIIYSNCNQNTAYCSPSLCNELNLSGDMFQECVNEITEIKYWN